MKKTVLCLVLLSLSLLAMAQVSHVVTAQNQAPINYAFGENVTMRVEVNMGAQSIQSVRLRYRFAQDIIYHSQDMKAQAPGSPIWETELKSTQIKDKDIQYYFEFVLRDLSVEVLPWEFDINGPYTLVPGPMSGKLNSGFVLLSADGEFESHDAFVFAVSFFEIAEDIDTNSIRVWVGGKDVTKKSTITENAVVYRDTKTNGEELRALITATLNKEKVQSQIWSLKTPKIKAPFPVNYSGSVNFATNIYDHNFSSDLNNIFENKNDWMSWAEASANYGKLTSYTNLLISSHEDKNSQRVNHYTLGFKLPFLEVAAGDYSPKISSFVLNNRNQYGLYAKLFAKQLGIEVVAGEMVRSTKLASVDASGSPISAPGGTFRQEVIGAKLRLGNENGFSLSINGARNRDIISSLPKEQYTYLNAQNEEQHSITPKDNLVLSLDMKLNIPDQSVVLGAEIAGSLLNTNTLDAPITADEIEQIAPDLDFLHPDELADFFIINRNMQPFLPSKNNLAATGYFRTFFWNNLFNISYTAVGSAFNSLSINQYPKDTSQINVSDQFFIGRYFNLTGGYNRNENNLSLSYSETQLNESWFAQAMLRIPYFPYIKGAYFNTDSSNKNNDKVQDISLFVPYKRNSNSLSVGLGYDFKKIPLLPSQLDLTYRMGTNNSMEGATNDLVYEYFSNSFNLSMTNRLIVLPLKTQFVFSVANQKKDLGISSTADLADENYTWFFKAEYAFFKEKLIPFGSYRRVNLTGDQAAQSFDYITFGLDARPISDMSISTGISQKYERFNDDPMLKNNLFTWNFLISQRF